MTPYLLVKWIHILSSVVLVGTGFGTAFYLYFGNRSGNVQAQAVVARLVVRADWWFTTPAVLIQPASGLFMAHLAGWPLTTPWLALSIALYVLTGALWLPVVWLQIRMAAMATAAASADVALPDRYWRYARRWEALGYPAFRDAGGVLPDGGQACDVVAAAAVTPAHAKPPRLSRRHRTAHAAPVRSRLPAAAWSGGHRFPLPCSPAGRCPGRNRSGQ